MSVVDQIIMMSAKQQVGINRRPSVYVELER